MKELLQLAVMLAAWGVAWWLVVKYFRRGKKGKLISHLSGAVVGSVTAIVVLIPMLPPEPESNKQAEDIPVAQQASVPAQSEKPVVASTPQIQVAAEKSTAPAQPVTSLGVAPEEFRKKYNQSIGQINKNYKTAEFDIEKGEVNDTFNRMLGANVGLIGSVNKSDGSLRELVFMISGGEKPEDALRPIVVLLTATQVLNPDTPKEQNSQIVMDMVKQALANIENGKAEERTVGALHYTAASSHITGLMFSISK